MLIQWVIIDCLCHRIYVVLKKIGKEKADKRYRRPKIEIFLTRHLGYAGKTPLEEATIDALAGLMNDFKYETSPYYNAYYNDGISAGELVRLSPKTFPVSSRRSWKPKILNHGWKSSSTSTRSIWGSPNLVSYGNFSGLFVSLGFFVDSGVTWVDLFVVDQIGTFINHAPGCLEGHEEVFLLMKDIIPNLNLASKITRQGSLNSRNRGMGCEKTCHWQINLSIYNFAQAFCQ